MVVHTKLNISQQYALAAKETNFALSILQSTGSRLKEMFLLLHSANVKPHLECNFQCWGPQYKRATAMLERVQWRATRGFPLQLRKAERVGLFSLRKRLCVLLTWVLTWTEHVKKRETDISVLTSDKINTTGTNWNTNWKKLYLNIKKHFFTMRVIKHWQWVWMRWSPEVFPTSTNLWFCKLQGLLERVKETRQNTTTDDNEEYSVLRVT